MKRSVHSCILRSAKIKGESEITNFGQQEVHSFGGSIMEKKGGNLHTPLS